MSDEATEQQPQPCAPWIPIACAFSAAGTTLIELAGQTVARAAHESFPPEVYRENARKALAKALEALNNLERLADNKPPIKLVKEGR